MPFKPNKSDKDLIYSDLFSNTLVKDKLIFTVNYQREKSINI